MELMEMAPRAIPRLGRVPEQRLLSPEIGLGWWRRGGTFRGRRLDCLGFSRDGEYMGGRARSVDARGPHTVDVSGKIGTSAFELSNSENISCVRFLKPKTAENRNWHWGNLSIG